VLAALLALAGCSITELEAFAIAGDESIPAQGTSSQRDTGFSQKIGTELLSLETVITGGQFLLTGRFEPLRRRAIGDLEEVRLEQPVAVGGVENMLYIVDAGSKLVYRYDLVVNKIEPIKEIATHFVGEPGNIYVAKDRSFYVVDTLGRQVLYFAEDGRLLTRFQDLANLSRPMDVLVNEESGDVYVADGSFSHIVVFNKMGQTMRAIGRRGTGPGRFSAITAITYGVDGLYVLDRLELPVQVLTWDGEYRYSFGESELVFPAAVAVDRGQRVFVADRSDNTIRVYQNGQLIMEYGGSGSMPGRFFQITGMWVNANLLYVADSLNRRVQVLRINPNALPIAPSVD
jgi:DNA-binding beta-propeller fold protein YncE